MIKQVPYQVLKNGDYELSFRFFFLNILKEKPLKIVISVRYILIQWNKKNNTLSFSFVYKVLFP